MKTGTRMLAVAVAAGALFALTAGAATAETPTPSTKTVPINLGFMPNMQGGAPIAIGEDQGYFAQEGLSLNKSSFTAGPVELTAMIAGSLDIGYIGPGAMPSLFKGEVALLTIDHPTDTEFLLASKASGVSTPSELKGKQVLYAAGTTGELVVRQALKAGGLTMSDISAVNSPDASSTTAYASGKAQIISVGPAFSQQAILSVPTNKVYNTDDAKNFNLPGVWVANKDFVKNNRDLVDRFLRAFGKANDYRAANLEATVPLTSKFVDVPAANLEPQVKNTKWWTTKETIAAINSGEVDTLLKGLNQNFIDAGALTAIAPVTTYFDGKATVGAYEKQSTGQATKSGGNDFPWVTVITVIIGLIIATAIVLIIRRARS